MARGTRSRTPGKDGEKRQLLKSLKAADFPSLVADILYFSKGHRHVKVMDGPGDGCRDIQSVDKNEATVITQCKCFEDPRKTVGSPDANELVVALLKFGEKRGIMATTGRFSPQLKREFTDNFPQLHLDWIDGADIVDEVFSNPLLFRAWVSGNSLGRETIYVKIPLVVRRAKDDSHVDLSDEDLGGGLSIEAPAAVDVGSLERFRPPETVHWTESFGQYVRCASLISSSPPDLHALEDLHTLALARISSDAEDVLTVRFGTPFQVPTKKPEFEKGIRIPGFSPRSYVVRPGKPAIGEHEFLLLRSAKWTWPEYLSVAEGDWGNWQTEDNQRWCHIEVRSPSFPNSTQSQVCRMIGNSTRKELRDAEAVFITATLDVCERLLESCPIEPDIQCANGPGGELLGWTLRDKNTRTTARVAVLAAVSAMAGAEVLDLETAIHITSRSDAPLIPSPGDDLYFPAQLYWEYETLPSPHYLRGRSCSFIEFWRIPSDLSSARTKLQNMSFPIPDDWHLYIDCKYGPKTKQLFPMFSVSIPWPIDVSTTELVEDFTARVDEVFKHIGETLRGEWPDAACATSEFWEDEVRFPAGAYISTPEGFVRSNWWPQLGEEGDD